MLPLRDRGEEKLKSLLKEKRKRKTKEPFSSLKQISFYLKMIYVLNAKKKMKCFTFSGNY